MPDPGSLKSAGVWQEMVSAPLKRLRNVGCDFADIFLEETAGGRVKIEDGRVDQVTQGGDFGAGLRLVRGEQTFFASTNNVTPAGLLAAAQSLATAAGQGALAPETMGAASPRPRRRGLVSPSPVAWTERLAAAQAAEAAARAAGAPIQQVTVFLGWNEQRIGIARSDGTWHEDERTQVVLWVNAVARQGEKLQTGFESAGGAQGWEYFREHGAGETGRLAGARAVRLLTARPAAPGRGCVVLAAEAGGTMIHEAVGHALEADLVQKKLSPYGTRVGQRVASELVSVADDATLDGWRGSFACDDEGTPAQRTLLVEQGVLRGFLHSRLTARLAGEPPTGNGRRQGYAHRPLPRMTNTMILPGSDQAADIIQSVSRGLYVVRMGGGQVNTVNGDFVFEINEAYVIENGVVGEPVLPTTMIGNAADVLLGIDRVASDFGRGLGTCGKDGQGVPVADAQPTLRIPEIVIGG